MHELDSQIKILQQLLSSSALDKWELSDWSEWTSAETVTTETELSICAALRAEFWGAEIKLSLLIQGFSEK